MILWTIQPVCILDELEQYGIYRPRTEKISMGEYFLPRYDWLCEFLEQKDSRPKGVDYPVWAWHTFCGKRKKPDLRHTCYGAQGEEMVCLEIDVPDNKVLLSDFELWHFVLNNWWLDAGMFQPGFTEEDYDNNQKWFDSLSEEEKQKQRELSWLNIFDVDQVVDNFWIRRGTDIQAIFWELRMEWVKKVRYFVHR